MSFAVAFAVALCAWSGVADAGGSNSAVTPGALAQISGQVLDQWTGLARLARRAD